MKIDDIVNCLTQQMESNPPNWGEGDDLLSMLFECYVEYNRLDTAEVNECFKQLDELLCALSPFEAEMVIDTACDLCRKHEKSAFIIGVQLGIRLAQEARIC